MNVHNIKTNSMRKPKWLKRRLPSTPVYEKVISTIKNNRLNTVCQEAKCPNQFECFSKQTATFLIMGYKCTRNCRFCNIRTGPTEPPDPEEPSRIAEAVASMGLDYVVVTSVTRDDITDGGAGIFAETINKIRDKIPEAFIEVLVPDFQGNKEALQKVLEARPHVLNHNIETVPRLYEKVRPKALYKRSLNLIKLTSDFDSNIRTKSGLILGLGETEDEIDKTLNDLYLKGCEILTIGQYLQPSDKHLPVKRYVHPNEFEKWRERAINLGFASVASGPFVRSSYNARELYNRAKKTRSEVNHKINVMMNNKLH